MNTKWLYGNNIDKIAFADWGDIDQESRNFEPKVPSLPHISSKAFELLVSGYIRLLNAANTESQQIVTVYNDLLMLCSKYYGKPFYIIVLDHRQLKVSLLDTSTNDTSITSKTVVCLNEHHTKDITNTVTDISETREEVGICVKRDINIAKSKIINNIDTSEKYTAIFKIGGMTSYGRDDYTTSGSKYCDLILYSQNITPSNFNTYYYKLPQLPFFARDNNPIYSRKYGGVIVIGNGEMARLNIDEDDKEMKWNIDKLPESLTFAYKWPPNYCFMNDNEKQLFIVNGETEHNGCVKQTSIYNLETKKYAILTENDLADSHGAIKYHYNTNRVWIGGGSDVDSRVYCYDLHKNIYISDLLQPKGHYIRPILHVNESGTVIHIASVDHWAQKLRYEFVDLRSAEKWWEFECKWINEEKIPSLSRKMWQWQQMQDSFLSVVDFE